MESRDYSAQAGARHGAARGYGSAHAACTQEQRAAPVDWTPPYRSRRGRARPHLPRGAHEPKRDGFRGLLENASGELRLWSRNARPLLRYFPELQPLGELLPPRSCLDGEIVIVRDGVLDFDAMQTRLHPAESRVRKLAAEIPSTFVAFDVLVWDGQEHRSAPLAERRTTLEEVGLGSSSRRRRATGTRHSNGSPRSRRSASTG